MKYDLNQLRVIESALFQELRSWEAPHLVGGPTRALIHKTLEDTRKHIVRLSKPEPSPMERVARER